MSGQKQQEDGTLRTVLRELIGDLAELDRAVVAASRSTREGGEAAGLLKRNLDLGFAGNLAYKELRGMAIDTVLGTLGDQTRLGGSFVDNLSFNLMRASPLNQDVMGPLDATMNRVTGVTGPIARAGGVVTDELRNAVFSMGRDQEIAAADEQRAVEQLGRQRAGEFYRPGTWTYETGQRVQRGAEQGWWRGIASQWDMAADVWNAIRGSQSR